MLLNPSWKKVIRLEDYGYFCDLWEDFAERAKTAPEALFDQLTSLTVGPLAVAKVGSDLSVYPALEALAKSFVNIMDMAHSER